MTLAVTKIVSGAAFVSRFGSEFRYLDLGDEAEPSPVMALNRGIRAGRGRNFALMIDGAHVVTPGVVAPGVGTLGVVAGRLVPPGAAGVAAAGAGWNFS